MVWKKYLHNTFRIWNALAANIVETVSTEALRRKLYKSTEKELVIGASFAL